MIRNCLLLAVLGLAAAPLSAKTYEIDPDHSTVMFKVRHLVTKVTGRFDKFSGTFDYEKGNPKTWKAEAVIDAASVNTNVAPRDKDLRSANFFDVEKCPTLAFKSTKVANVKGDKAKLFGELTIHCVTKPVVLDLETAEEAKDPWGNTRIGMSATTRVNRKDFGLNWNKALETGGVLVGDDVDISLDIEALAKQAAAPSAKQ